MGLLRGVGNALHGVADGAGKLVPGKRNKDKNSPSLKQSPFESPAAQPQLDEQAHFPELHSSLNQAVFLSGEAKAAKLKEVERQLQAASQELQATNLEAQVKDLPPAEAEAKRNDCQMKQRQLKALQEWYEDEVRGTGSRPPEVRRTKSNKDQDCEQKVSLLGSQASGNSSECSPEPRSSRRTLHEANSTGMASIDEMQGQRKSFERNKSGLGETSRSLEGHDMMKPQKKFLGVF